MASTLARRRAVPDDEAATATGSGDAARGATMHWLTLRFPAPADEAAFRADYREQSLRQMRVSLLLGFGLYAAFGVLDAWVIPDAAGPVRWIRYAIVCPLIAVVFALSFPRAPARYLQPAMALGGLVANLGIVVMTVIAGPPGNYLYYAGLLLAATFIYTFMRLRFVYALAANVATLVAYGAAAASLTLAPDWLLANNLAFLVAINIVGASACYYMERHARDDFLRRRTIRRQAEELAATLQRTALARDLAEERSRRDALTGLFNRMHFREALEVELGRAARAGTYLAVVLMDLDGFARVNEQHGDAEGDRVLRRVAAALQRCLRGADLAARYAGERFAILLPDTAPFEAGEVAERLRIMIEGKTSGEASDEPRITASLGVAVMPAGQHWRVRDLTERAARALDRAKATGRNRAVAWDADLDDGGPGGTGRRRH